MAKTAEEFVQAQAEAVKTFSASAQKTLEGFQKLAALNLQTAKASIEASTDQIKALLAAKDIKNVTELVTTFARPPVDKFAAYAKAAYAVSSETGAEMVDQVRAQIEKGNHQLLGQIQELAKNAPGGSDGAVNFVKQVLAVANSSYEQLTQATKSLVEAGFTGMATSATVAAPAAAPVASKSAKA